MNPTKVERQGMPAGEIQASEETEIIPRVSRSEDPLRDELLRGIHNETTLRHILTKLPRISYEVVAKVNPDWQRAFQSRMVYDSRFLSQSTQEFFLVSCRFSSSLHHDFLDEPTISKRTFSLFSPNEERWYKIPPIPGCHEGMLHDGSYVLLDCSIYLLGGTRGRKKWAMPSAEVLVLDLAVYPLEWRRCANMQAPRLDPGIGVLNRKIYVFGGHGYSDGFLFEARNEVYDPDLDAWSFIASMPSASVQSVYTVRQQFFACMGCMSTPRDHSPVRVVSENDIDTKFVVTVSNLGPKLVSTGDDDTEDDMGPFHEMIRTQLVDQRVLRNESTPAERLADEIERYEVFELVWPDIKRFFGFYDPVNDQWREFDNEILGTDNVEDDWPKYKFYVWPTQGDSATEDDDTDDDGELDEHPTVSVRSISL